MHNMYWYWTGLLVGCIATQFSHWVCRRLFTPMPEAKKGSL